MGGVVAIALLALFSFLRDRMITTIGNLFDWARIGGYWRLSGCRCAICHMSP
jgi:hypothetical protein